MDGWESPLTPGSLPEMKLRQILTPVSTRITVDHLVNEFLLSGASYLSYKSGITLSLEPFAEEKYSMVRICEYKDSTSPVYVGLDLSSCTTVRIDGNESSGKSTFALNFFPKDVTSRVDFAKVDFSSLSSSTKKDYGNSVAMAFIRNPNLKYLIIDHFSHAAATKRKYHPALYFDMLSQIMESLNMFKDYGKILVMAEVDRTISSDVTIELGKDLLKREFLINDVAFPMSKLEKR